MFKIWSFTTNENCTRAKIWPKQDNFLLKCEINILHLAQKTVKISRSGEISPNLVTLHVFNLVLIKWRFSITAFMYKWFYLIIEKMTKLNDYFLNIWPFRKMKIWPIARKSCHGKFKMFPSVKLTLIMLPQDFCNFTKVVKFRQLWWLVRFKPCLLLSQSSALDWPNCVLTEWPFGQPSLNATLCTLSFTTKAPNLLVYNYKTYLFIATKRTY